MVQWLVSLAVLLSITALSGSVGGNKKTSTKCAATLPSIPRFVPPSPYQQDPPNEMFWYGSKSLWTLLGIAGTWPAHGKVYRTKLVYWRQGFDSRKEVHPELIVVAKRLDREAPLVRAEHANAVFVTGPMMPAIMTAIDIPSAGCWELTAEYREQRLSFVVSVQP